MFVLTDVWLLSFLLCPRSSIVGTRISGQWACRTSLDGTFAEECERRNQWLAWRTEMMRTVTPSDVCFHELFLHRTWIEIYLLFDIYWSFLSVILPPFLKLKRETRTNCTLFAQSRGVENDKLMKFKIYLLSIIYPFEWFKGNHYCSCYRVNWTPTLARRQFMNSRDWKKNGTLLRSTWILDAHQGYLGDSIENR